MKAEPNPEADTEFKAAQTLFQQGKLDEAENAFDALAKKRKGHRLGRERPVLPRRDPVSSGASSSPPTTATSCSWPTTRAPSTSTRSSSASTPSRQTWLARSDPKAPADKKLPWHARFDGSRAPHRHPRPRPAALEHVRHHNPKGELADDAVLRIADEHMAQADYESAALYYDQLITDHPKSPFLQRAQLASIDARMKGYLGPEYDGAGLEKARELIKQTMATFPDRTAGNEKLYHTLDLINDQEAERTYVIGDYYRRAGKVASAEYYFGKIPQRWPKSPWAVKAKTQLASLAKMPRKPSAPEQDHDPARQQRPDARAAVQAEWVAWAWAAWEEWVAWAEWVA